jgi:hypothetical protein
MTFGSVLAARSSRPSVASFSPPARKRGMERRSAHHSHWWRALRERAAPSGAPSRRFSASGRAFGGCGGPRLLADGAHSSVSELLAAGPSLLPSLQRNSQQGVKDAAGGRCPGASRCRACDTRQRAPIPIPHRYASRRAPWWIGTDASLRARARAGISFSEFFLTPCGDWNFRFGAGDRHRATPRQHRCESNIQPLRELRVLRDELKPRLGLVPAFVTNLLGAEGHFLTFPA